MTASPAAAAFLQAFETVLVVFGALLFVRKNFVGRINFFERVFVPTLIWVVFDSELSVGLFDFLTRGAFFNL